MGSRTINMTTGSPAKHILSFAVPLILTNVGQQFYMIADASIVGRLLPESQNLSQES